jgi:hypothetical protein
LIPERTAGLADRLLLMLLMLCSYHVVTNAESFSMQWIGIFFSVLGLTVFKRRPYLGLFIMTLGIMAKQNQLAAPAAALVWLFLRDGRKALAPAAFFLACVALELSALRTVFGPGFFEHVIRYAAGSYDAINFLRLTAYCISPYLIMIGLVWPAVRDGFRDNDKKLVVLYFCFNFILTFATFRVGSDSKYYQEFYLALFMLAGPRAFSSKGWALKAMVLQMALLSIFSAYMFRWNSMRVAEKSAAVNSIVPELKELGGDIIVEDPQMALRSGHRLYLEAFPMAALARQGLWNQGGFVSDLASGKFGALVLQFDLELDDASFASKERFTDDMIGAMRAGYYLEKKQGPIYLYRPKREKK